MTKRERIRNKYGRRCAYTGLPLGDDWQIDHVISKRKAAILLNHYCHKINVNDESNLVPCLPLVNHYKRSLSLDDFRKLIEKLHIKMAKFPKWFKDGEWCTLGLPTRIARYRTDKARKCEYIKRVAELFGITPDAPFDGLFWFEKDINFKRKDAVK